MSYRHILVAVDLAKGSQEVIEKAVSLAKPLNARVSLIHVDDEVTHEGAFSGLIDTDIAELEPAHPTVNERKQQIEALAASIDYPIERKLLVQGDLSHGLEGTVAKVEADLIVCGHHHGFWSRLAPSSRNLVNTSPVDLLIVPLKDE
jgi:universal stress protein A